MQAAQPQIQKKRQALPAVMRKEAVVRELIIALCNAGYLQRMTKSFTTKENYATTFEVYSLTQLGQTALSTNAAVAWLLSGKFSYLCGDQQAQKV